MKRSVAPRTSSMEAMDLSKRGKYSKVERANRRWHSLCFCLLFFAACSLGFMLYFYAQIAGVNRLIREQELSLQEKEKTSLSLVGENEGLKSSSEIANDARYKLGMVYPSEGQIVYIDVHDEREDARVDDNVFLSPVISVLHLFGD